MKRLMYYKHNVNEVLYLFHENRMNGDYLKRLPFVLTMIVEVKARKLVITKEPNIFTSKVCQIVSKFNSFGGTSLK